jgi:hypothetical protein
LASTVAIEKMRTTSVGTMTEAFKAIGLHNAMYAIPVLALAAAAVLFAASRTMEKDVRKQELAH